MPLALDKDDSRYFIAGDYFLPPTNFTPAEALSIIALAGQLGADDRLPFYRPARYGDQAQVLRPAKLRRLVAQRAKNMQRMYEE